MHFTDGTSSCTEISLTSLQDIKLCVFRIKLFFQVFVSFASISYNPDTGIKDYHFSLKLQDSPPQKLSTFRVPHPRRQKVKNIRISKRRTSPFRGEKSFPRWCPLIRESTVSRIANANAFSKTPQSQFPLQQLFACFQYDQLWHVRLKNLFGNQTTCSTVSSLLQENTLLYTSFSILSKLD